MRALVLCLLVVACGGGPPRGRAQIWLDPLARPGRWTPPPVAAGDSRRGSAVMRSQDGRTLYVADTDRGVVMALDLTRWTILAERALGGGPERLVTAPDGRVFVTVPRRGEVVALSHDLRVERRVGVGKEPWGIALAPDGRSVYVTDAGGGTLTALATHGLRRIRTVDLLYDDPRAVAIAPDGQRAYVTHLRSDWLSVVDLGTGDVADAIHLPTAPDPGRKIANRAIAAAVSPDGRDLFVAYDVKDVGKEGRLRGQIRAYYGSGQVSAMLARIPLDASAPAALLPLAMVDPSDVEIFGQYVFVAGAGGQVECVDVASAQMYRGLDIEMDVSYAEGVSAAGFDIVAFDPIAFTLHRQYGWGANPRQPPDIVIHHPFPSDLALGRRLFHLPNEAVSASRVPCQSCHPFGRDDGLAWDVGEDGPLQTPMLAGHLADTAPYRWLGTAPTIEDSIRQTIAGLGGVGLADGELHRFARFLRDGLPPSRPREGETLSAEESRGREIFASPEVGCASCHDPESGFQDGQRHALVAAGSAPTETVRSLGTPTLRDLAATAPYLHDGRASTIEEVIEGFNRDDRMGRTSQLSPDDRRALVSYLRTL